ncbi:hypothetical protein diail_3188 [Diaporthe ilicicola]|nr:hypothetical protein diail_3188 [Diaporthe ilicicola]
MADFSGAVVPSPSQAKRSINGLSQLLSQRLSSTPHMSPAAPRDADDDLSPPPSSAAAAAVLSPPSTSSRAPTNRGAEAQRGGGHFAQFLSQDFEPDNSASFGDEWERLRASQGWVPGSQVYKRERARALRNELRSCYFPASSVRIKEEEEGDMNGGKRNGAATPNAVKEEEDVRREDSKALTEAESELLGFQAMCTAVGKQPGDTPGECKAALRATLVNIVDLIDARRMGQEVQVWTDFDKFCAYTMGHDKMIPLDQAKEDELLQCFLKKIRIGGGRFGGRGARKRERTSASKSSVGPGLDGRQGRKRLRVET